MNSKPEELLKRVFDLLQQTRASEAHGLITKELLRKADEVRIELAKFGYIVDR